MILTASLASMNSGQSFWVNMILDADIIFNIPISDNSWGCHPLQNYPAQLLPFFISVDNTKFSASNFK